MVRYADDVVVAFQYRDDAARFAETLREREVWASADEAKTRLIECGRFAASNAARRSQKPETFDFLGFTQICGVSRKARFKVLRQTASKRLRRAISRVAAWWRKYRHPPVPVQWRYLGSVLRGHYQYYGVTGNFRSPSAFTSSFAVPGGSGWTAGASGGAVVGRFRAGRQRDPLPAAWLPHSVYRLA